MNAPEEPNDQTSQGFSVPRWMVPIFWAVGVLLVHNIVPWGLSFLSVRIGWAGGRPGQGNLFSLILIGAGLMGIIWTLAQHFVRTSQRVKWVRTPGYLLLRGPYKFTRNPMYLAELVLWLGWALFYGSVAVFIAFVLLWVLMNFIAIPREERDLEARFGEDYPEYKRKVPRWLGKSGE